LAVSASKGLVIFDCDGVLVDSEPLAAKAYENVLKRGGMAIPAGVMQGCIGLKQDDIFARMEQATGRKIPTELRATLWPETRRLFEAQLQPTAGMVNFLDGLTARRCVASSSHLERIVLSLRLTRLEDYFGGHIFSTQMVKRGKPAPDIFLYAAEQMGADPADCVVIEDSAPGIQGARAAGMTTIGFLGGQHAGPGHGKVLAEAGATHLAQSWAEVARLFTKLQHFAV
jgi:HAD superfamily hydrolase (TIGR01509 family)